jgi:hypothetical protein
VVYQPIPQGEWPSSAGALRARTEGAWPLADRPPGARAAHALFHLLYTIMFSFWSVPLTFVFERGALHSLDLGVAALAAAQQQHKIAVRGNEVPYTGQQPLLAYCAAIVRQMHRTGGMCEARHAAELRDFPSRTSTPTRKQYDLGYDSCGVLASAYECLR